MEKGIYFLSLALADYVCCFGEKAIIDFSDGKGLWKKWTVILGDNGTGKTTLLQILAGFEFEKYNDKRQSDNYSPLGIIGFKGFESSEVIDNNNYKVGAARVSLYPNFDTHIDGIPLSNYVVPELRFIGYQNVAVSIHYNQALLELKCFGYGANRSMGYTSLAEHRVKNSVTLFEDNIPLINAEEWLLQLDYSANVPSDIQQYAKQKRDKVKEILIDVLPEVEEIRFTSPTKENIIPKVEFKTSLGWTSIQNLSLGYKTMVAWIVDLVYRMFERYPNSNNPLNEPAIVLIDEIDLHLHPKWQRKIFNYLSNKFPATQFIVTAHSPLIVQSVPNDANLVLLRNEGDHVVIDQKIENVRKWRIDQILSSELFDIPVRNDEVEKILSRRKELLRKRDLSPNEKLELDRLNKEAETLPYAESETDIEAKEIIRKAAEH